MCRHLTTVGAKGNSKGVAVTPQPAQEIQEVELARLRFGLSPRSDARDESYIRTLAERFDDLPPIVVHGDTLVIIDGVHRVLAAGRLGRTRILAAIFVGTEDEARVEAVQLNIVHGKPLTLHERESAAGHFLRSHPEWSDRRVAEICGLSPKTIGRVRNRVLEDSDRRSSRVGRDGRARPTDPAAVRQRVADLLSATPASSAREIAAVAGTSQATVLDVRRRLQQGDAAGPQERASDVGTWSGDAALTATTSAYRFTQWFERTAVSDAEAHTAAVPLSRIYAVVDECRRRARQWEGFAAALEQRARRSSSAPGGLIEATNR